ncbi:MAG: PD40 domain-containing protein, partial [Cyclobacteriaceae bacterium]|nr:PD40 domain-containing protein [Cyclobacteriaceae bacterium]
AEVWADPESIPSINRPNLDHIGSFCLSYDGNFVVFSSRRSPGIGNYDIWISEKIGNNWSQPKNPGKPLNSPSHEGNPSLSPDGKSIYFMRCESMDKTKKSNCKLYVSHRVSTTRWSEPEALPDYINTNHETTPRILADNNTLVFASGRSGGKGMLDLYSTTLEYNTWTKPKPLSFINTDQNDEFISIPARGDIIYFSGSYRDNHHIFKAIIPEEYRARKVLMLTGTVTYDDGQKPSDDILIQAFDLSTGEVFTTTKLKQNDDSYTIFLPEGASYDVSAFPQKGGHSYHSQIYDLTNMLISRKEQIPVSLSALTPGISMPLTTIRFEDYSSALTNDSNIEIKRIIGFLKKNPGFRIEIGAFIDQVYTDSIPSNDLTEVIADTVFFQIQKEELLSAGDSLDFESLNSEVDDISIDNDSLNDSKDSLAFLESNDSLTFL